MFDYLQQFNNLSKDLRDRISSPEVMSAISALEIKYKVELAAFVMKVMIKKYSANKLAFPLMSDLKMSSDNARLLEKELLEKVFFVVKDYLQISEVADVNGKKEDEGSDNKLVNRVVIGEKEIKKNLETKVNEEEVKKKLFFQKQKKISVIEESEDRLLIESKKTKKLDKPDREINNNSLNKEVSNYLKETSKQEKADSVVSKKMEENKDIELVSKHNLSIDKQVKEVIIASSISLSSTYLEDRLSMALKTYIKGVRDKVSTRSALVRGISEGGIGLDNVSVDKLFKNISHLKSEKQESPVMTKPPISSSLEKKQVEERLKNINDSYDLKKSIENKKESDNIAKKKENPFPIKKDEKEIKEDNLTNLSTNIERVEIKTIEEEKSDILKVPATKDKDKENEEAKDQKRNLFHFSKKNKQVDIAEGGDKSLKLDNLPKERQIVHNETKPLVNNSFTPQTERNKFQPKLNPSKPRLDDIRMVNKIMDPVDELRYIDIVNFRRLGKTPDEAISKIKIKFNLLEKSSYEKMILGIEAWRQNPLNQLYRDITIESINQGKPIPEIIKQREVEKKDILSVEEFKTLINFNREITF